MAVTDDDVSSVSRCACSACVRGAQVVIVPTFEAAERLLLRFVGPISCCTRGGGSGSKAAAPASLRAPSVDAACIADEDPSVAAASSASSASPGHASHGLRPSLPLMLASRTAITAVLLLCACALPFFGAVMGFVGELCIEAAAVRLLSGTAASSPAAPPPPLHRCTHQALSGLVR